ncbi:MAG: universal stress protein [Archaeoglobaceae archaeon]
MFDKVLYPTDFSKASIKALKYVRRMKDCGVKEVVLLHVIDFEDLLGDVEDIESGKVDIDMQKHFQEAESKLEDMKKEIDGIEIKTMVKVGKPHVNIVETAEEEKASVIVLGSHGRNPARVMLLGSCSENVLKLSKKPVLVVK